MQHVNLVVPDHGNARAGPLVDLGAKGDEQGLNVQPGDIGTDGSRENTRERPLMFSPHIIYIIPANGINKTKGFWTTTSLYHRYRRWRGAC